MNDNSSALAERNITDTPIAIVDLETTGLSPGADRAVEVSVVRIDPGGKPQLVFDTLLNPLRPVSATEIHGISDRDVLKAPTFQEIAGDFVRAISGCAVAAYNVYFDIRFIEYELRQAGITKVPPHFCLMYMRPMLGLGPRCSLEDACRAHGIEHTLAHTAGQDALVSAGLMERYLEQMASMGVTSFGDLGRLKQYKFVKSFAAPPLDRSVVKHLDQVTKTISRCGWTPSQISKATPPSVPSPSPPSGIKIYWEALKATLADLEVTHEELTSLKATKAKFQLDEEQVRVLHARAFSSVLAQYTQDGQLDSRECGTLCRLHRCLHALGWAPGDPIT
jgi:DNA polymerase III epsilon subunit-like protein